MSRDFQHTLASFRGTPWAILPSKLEEIHAVLLARIARHGEPVALKDDGDFKAMRGEDKPFDQVGPVAVIGIRGTIMPRASLMSEYSGGVSAERIAKAVEMAAADTTVKSILLDIDSPGGAVYGIPEAGAKIAAAKASKRVVAVANPVAASAAYWLAAQASEIVVTPSGQVGSVGIVAIHTDTSAADAKEGVKYTIVSAGKFKAERAPFAPLSETALEAWQSDADQYYAMFVDAVAKGRRLSASVVDETFGQGRMKLAADAVKTGMADRVGTLQSVLQEMTSAAGGGTGRMSAEADAGRRRREMAMQFAEKGLPTA